MPFNNTSRFYGKSYAPHKNSKLHIIKYSTQINTFRLPISFYIQHSQNNYMARVRRSSPVNRRIRADSMNFKTVGDSSIYGETSFPYGAVTSAEASTTTEYDKSVSLFQKNISLAELYETATRNPLASVIIMDVASDVFAKGFEIKEINDEHEIVENKKLNNRFQYTYEHMIKQELIKAYQLARLYGYSLLLLGYDDGLDLSLPPDSSAKIKYVFAVSRRWVEEIEYHANDNGEVYLPLTIKSYKLNEGNATDKKIHPKRVVHIENPGIGSFKTGTSAILPCYDDLLVLKHVTWGAGQTMWRSGNQLVVVIAPPRASADQIAAIDTALTDLNAQSAFTLPFGSTVNAYTPSGLNPEPYASIPLNNIAAATRIPISILIGAQSGALSASLTDQRDYANTLAGIQANVLTPILNDIFKRFKYTGQLDMVNFKIEWKSTLTMSLAEQTMVEYRQALTAEKEWKLEQEKAAANSERNSTGTWGIQPTESSATTSTPTSSYTSSEYTGTALEELQQNAQGATLETAAVV